MSNQHSNVGLEETASFDAFQANCAALSSEEKRRAIYWLLHDLMGARPTQESDVCDTDGFVYLHLVPPGLREQLRSLQYPEREEQLQTASMEPMFSLQQIRHELGVIE